MTDPAQPAAFTPDDRYDEIIVGAGIAGLATALMFALRGRRVIVLEARALGDGTTAHSTGKISALQGVRLTEVAERNAAGVVPAYAQSQLAAVAWLRAFLETSGVAHETRDAVTFAVRDDGAARIGSELRLGREAGLPLESAHDLDLPFATKTAVRLRDQLAVDPSLLIAALADAVRAEGGVIDEHTRVTGVRASSPALVHTASGSGPGSGSGSTAGSVGSIRAEHVIIATGSPILDRGLYFAKIAAKRSYLMTSSVAEDAVPDDMFLGIDSPIRSIRNGFQSGGPQLVTGGAGHSVGRADPVAAAERLRAATRAAWPDSEEQALWSAQDYETPHMVPFVGWLPRGRKRVYLATGFGKWGLTNGVSSAMTLVADILGEPTEWQTVLHHRLTLPQAIGAGFGENLAVGTWYARGWFDALTHRAPDAAAEGEGSVGRRGIVPTAVSTIDGDTVSLCAVCPHLGAIVGWNALEQSWDCPAHGSRFSADGQPIDGPASRPMTRL